MVAQKVKNAADYNYYKHRKAKMKKWAKGRNIDNDPIKVILKNPK